MCIRDSIKPVNEADVEKMMVILNRMREEDPTWEVEQSKELKQTIVHGQGEFHLRTLKWRLENNEKLQDVYKRQGHKKMVILNVYLFSCLFSLLVSIDKDRRIWKTPYRLFLK